MKGQQGWFLQRPLSLAYRRLPSHCVCILCPNFLSLQDTSHAELGPPSETSFKLNYLFKGPIQIQSHFEILGDGTSTYEF